MKQLASLILILTLVGCGGGAANNNATPVSTTATTSTTPIASPSPSPSASASPSPSATPLNLTATQIAQLAAEAYIYGYAPVVVAQKQYDQTNSTSVETVYAPLNALYIDTQINTPDSALWVSPNVNVLYSEAHVELTAQPMMLFTPALTSRYYSWEIMDAYTNAFNYVGTRATNGAQGTYAFVGPSTPAAAQKLIPANTTIIQCPTDTIWIVGRFEVAPGSQSDLNTVVGLVQTNVMLPLDKFLTRPQGYVNPIISKPAQTVAALNISGLNFYSELNKWLTKNPPPSADAPELAKLAAIGVGPNMTTDFTALPQDQQVAMLTGAELALADITVQSLFTGTLFNGWRYTLGPNFGTWGTSYLLRSETARGGLGANINAEAIYPLRVLDQNFEGLQPDRNYTITFPAGQLPVNNKPGFWSITMYDRTNAKLVANSINRYSLGSQNTLNTNPDGSTTIFIQRADPGGANTANWLPTAQTGTNPFYLLFRTYNPNTVMYLPADNPGYKVPELRRVL